MTGLRRAVQEDDQPVEPVDILALFSVGEWILIGTSAVYVILLIVAFLRKRCHDVFATENIKTHRYTEIFNMWLWMFAYTLVYVCGIMGLLELVYLEDWFSVGVIGVALILSTLYASTVDVLGVSGTSGLSCFRLCDALGLAVGLYQMNCVWKMAGHLEVVRQGDVNKRCLGCQVGELSPDVKDAKDIVCIQGVLMSIPTLFTLIGTFVLSEGNSAWPTGLIISVVGTVCSALLGIMLVDWDAAHNDYKLSGCKKYLFMAMSFVKRLLELAGFLCYFAYFLIVNQYLTLVLLAVNFFLMWATQIPIHAVSTYSRLATPLSTWYLAFGSIWFGSFKRITVDKEYVGKISSAMPPAIDLLRYVLKGVTYVLAFYITWSLAEAPELNIAENFPVTILAWGGVIAMALLIVVVLIEYICFRRKAVKCADAMLIVQYYVNGPFKFLCGDATVIVNKDEPQNNIPYH